MKQILFYFFLLIPILSYSQKNTEFEQIYSEGENCLYFSYDSCLQFIEELKELPNCSELQKIRIDLLEIQANCQLLSIDSSIHLLHACQQQLSELKEKDEKVRAELLILLGSINSANSNIVEGIPQLMEAHKILSNLDDPDLLAYCKIKIAEAQRVKKQFKIGFDLLYTLLKDPNLSQRNRASLYSRMAAYYDECKTGEVNFTNSSCSPTDSILKYSELSLQLAQKQNYKDVMALANNQMGHYLLFYESNVDRAILCLKKAGEMFTDLAYRIDYVNTCNNLTFAYEKRGQFQEAIVLGKSLLEIRKQNEYPQIYRKTYQYLANSYDSIGNYRLANKYLEKAYAIEKDLFKTYLNKEVTALTTKYNYELREAQLAEEKQKGNFRLTLFLGVLLIIITLLIVAIVINRLRKTVFIQKQQQLKNRNFMLQSNLAHQNKLVTMNALRFIQNNNLLNEISQQVGAMEYLNKGDLKNAIQKLISEIRVSKKNEIWNDFEKSFREVHADFYKNITYNNLDFSAKELRLAVFLKLNLTSKEIAAINGTSLRAVETARHRLRKKLNMDEGTDLNSYFQQF
jgi:tetratricopeptide (TPR) repeat protein